MFLVMIIFNLLRYCYW